MIAGVAQLVEQLICNQPVAGSNPVTSFQELSIKLPIWQGFRTLKRSSVVILVRPYRELQGIQT